MRTLSEQNRSKILTAARVLFLERGYDRSRMEDIADSARVSKETVYRYFPSKGMLRGAIIEEGRDRCLMAMRGAITTDNRASDRLIAAVGVLLQSFCHDPFSALADIQPQLLALFRGVLAEGVVGGEWQIPDIQLAALGLIGTAWAASGCLSRGGVLGDGSPAWIVDLIIKRKV